MILYCRYSWFFIVGFNIYWKEDIQYLFKEFAEYECKFKPCNHIEEIQCGVKHAVEEEAILQSRYDDYKALFKEKEAQKRKYIKEK